MRLRLDIFFQLTATFSALLTIFCTGTHEAWSSVYIPQMLNSTSFEVTGAQGSWIVSFLDVGGLVGSCLTILADRFGRKTVLLLCSIPYFVSIVLLVYANSVFMFCTARFAVGVAIGVVIPLIPIYLGEIAHPKFRGGLVTCYYVFNCAGFLVMNVAGPYLTIQQSAYMMGGNFLLFIVTFMWMPESPYYLIMVDKKKQAEQSLEKLRGISAVETEFARISEAVREERHKSSISNMFTIKSNRRALWILVIVLNAKQLTGDGPFYAYAQTIFTTTCGELVSPILMAAICYVIKLLVLIWSIRLIDKYGRKPLFLTTLLISGLLLLMISIYTYLNLHTEIQLNFAVKLAAVVLVLLFYTSYSFVSMVPVVVLSELFPVNVKRFAFLFYGIYYFVTDFAMVKFFQIASDAFGMDVPLFVFTAIALVHCVLVHIFMFETKKKTLEEIQLHLRKN